MRDVFDSQCWPAVALNQVLEASSSCSSQSLQIADGLTMMTDPCLLDMQAGKRKIIDSTNKYNSTVYMHNADQQWYLNEAGTEPRQWECSGEEVGSDTAGAMPSVEALTVTHPEGETRPIGYSEVRTTPIFHNVLFWCTHSLSQCWTHHTLPYHSCYKNLTYSILPFFAMNSILHPASLLWCIGWCACPAASHDTIHHANQAVSKVKMNWLWVRAMRSRAYGSDEAENWPQRNTESEGGRGRSHKEKERRKVREYAREREVKEWEGEVSWRKSSIQKYRPL